jgi:hypothetical protein
MIASVLVLEVRTCFMARHHRCIEMRYKTDQSRRCVLSVCGDVARLECLRTRRAANKNQSLQSKNVQAFSGLFTVARTTLIALQNYDHVSLKVQDVSHSSAFSAFTSISCCTGAALTLRMQIVMRWV